MELRSVVNAQPPLLTAIDLLRFDTETVGLPAVGGSSEVLGLDVQAEDAQLAERILDGNLESPPPLPVAAYGTDGDPEQETVRDEMNTILKAAAVGGAQVVDDWQTYCRQNGLEIAPDISPTVLDEVRGALRCATKPRFDVLHRHYRRQCLGLASVEVRLETVRLIAQRDHANSTWQEELRRLEVARVEELKQDLETALANGEPEAADSILELLQSAEWCDPHAARRLVVESESRVNEAWGRFAHSRMQAVADEMFKHYMAEAVDQVEAQLSVWEHYCERLQRVGMTAPEGPAATAAAVLDWLQRRKSEQRLQQARQSARETLERLAIDSMASPTALNTALIEAERIGSDLPPTLRDVTNSRLRAHRLQQRNWRRLKVVLVGCAAAGVLAVGVWAALTLRRQQRLEEFVSSLDAAVNRRDTPRVEQLSGEAEAVREGFISDPRVVAAMNLHKELLEKADASERARAARFQEEFDDAGDPESPTRTQKNIDEAAKHARTPAEHSRVDGWRESFRKAQSQRTTKFRTELDALSSQIDELEQQDIANPETQKTLDEVADALTRLRIRPGVDDDARDECNRLDKRVSTLRDEGSSLARLKELDRAVNDPAMFFRQLEEFATSFPTSPYSEQFKQVVNQRDLHLVLVEWSVLASKFALNPFPVSQKDRDDIYEQLKAFRDKAQNNPVDALLKEYQELLSNDHEWPGYVIELFREQPNYLAKQVLLHDGTRFFYDPKTPPEGPTYKVWTSSAGDTFESQMIFYSHIVSDDDSPQYKLGQKIEKVITGRAAQRDGGGALRTIRLIRDDSEVDPVCRVDLLKELLPKVQKAVPCLKEPIEQCIRLLEELPEPEVDWILRGNPKNRREYERFVDALKDVEVESWEGIRQQAVERISKWLSGNMRAIGWLDSIDPKRSLRLGIGVRLTPEEGLFVITNSGSLLQIGKVGANGAPSLNTSIVTKPSGSLVFARTVQVPKPTKGVK
jgi:hypothetical protein